MSSFLPIQKQPFFCCERNWHGYVPFKRCTIYLPLWAEVLGSVLVCRNQHPTKENFKMGRGGKEGFSINVMECHSRGRTLLVIKITILLLAWFQIKKILTKIGFFFQLAGYFNYLNLYLKLGNPFFVLPPTKMGQFVGTFANKISCLNYLPGLIYIYLANKINRNGAGMNTNNVQNPTLKLCHPSRLSPHCSCLSPPTRQSLIPKSITALLITNYLKEKDI